VFLRSNGKHVPFRGYRYAGKGRESICHNRSSASTFAAQMKSFSDSPPTECVL
jgi:hypothetical protein